MTDSFVLSPARASLAPSSAYRNKRLLVSWYTDPQYIPPFLLSERQITVGPRVRRDQVQGPLDGFTPFGRHDLLAALKDSGLPTQFDAIVVATDSSLTNLPVNLEAFDCPKILCVGDTQHLWNPIRTLIDYAKAVRYDFVFSANNRQHLHWFIEDGFSNVAWLPGIKVRDWDRPFSAERKAQVCFFGRAGKYHVKRAEFLAELGRRNPFPLAVMSGKAHEAADQYASSAVSLNFSLNGDLNMRIFEVLSAGGCLLTDRLSEQSGLGLLLKEGKEFVGYDSIDECIEQARFLLDHPQSALAIARAGNAAVMSRMRSEQRVQQLFDWVFRGQLDSLFQVRDFHRPEPGGPSLSDRIRVYEELQEIHRVKTNPAALVMSDVPEAHLLDALDLRHFKFAIVNTDATTVRAKSPAVAERCVMERLDETRWDCLIARNAESGFISVIETLPAGAAAPEGPKRAVSRLKDAVWRRFKSALPWPRA